MILDPVSTAEASAMLDGKHYLGPPHIPPVVHCVATRKRDAVVVFSYPCRELQSAVRLCARGFAAVEG